MDLKKKKQKLKNAIQALILLLFQSFTFFFFFFFLGFRPRSKFEVGFVTLKDRKKTLPFIQRMR